MSNLKLPVRSTAEEYRALLAGKESAKIAYATTLHNSPLSVAVAHHGSVIFRLYNHGKIAFTLAGWSSATTSNRLHQLLQAANPRLGLGIAKGEPRLHINPNKKNSEKYPRHQLEIAPGGRCTVEESAGVIAVIAHSKSAKYYDAGHQAYQFQTH